MDRREFIKGAGIGLATIMVAGCGLNIGKGSAAAAATGGNSKGGSSPMKITMITGSPHKAGTSALLADRFMEGAQQAGHEVYRFNAGLMEDLHPCIACDHCGMNGPCIYQDSIEKEMLPHVLESQMVVFVTPLYYYTVSAQLKTCIDRFYSRAGQVSGGRKAVLMATAYNDADWTMSALTTYYKTLLRYLNWEDSGMVLATGCGARSLIEKSKFPDEAYQLGLHV